MGDRKTLTQLWMWSFGGAGIAAALASAFLAPPRLTSDMVVPIAIFALTGFLAGIYQIRLTSETVVSICVAAFFGGVLAFGPVIGSWLAAGVDFFITLVDNHRVKRGLAAPPPAGVMPGRLIYNTGLNAAMFVAGGFAYRAVAGDAPFAAFTLRSLAALAALFAAVDAVSTVHGFVLYGVRHSFSLRRLWLECATSVTYDLPLLPAALALALLYSHNMVWGLACGGASVVLASVLLHRENRLDLVVNRYVSRAKSSKILATPYELMRPERRDISVLFADLRGTTGISQELAPAEMLALLNEFHRRMLEEVARARATVDKILGDGLMVLVGAPLRVDDHAARAVQLALAMQRRHRAWREERARDGQTTPGMGIGVATGDVVIGNVGSELRLDYTAIGGEVNVASKICAVAEAGEIFVSRGCRSRVEEVIAAGRAPYLAGVRFEDFPPVTVRRLPRPLELVKVIFDDATPRP